MFASLVFPSIPFPRNHPSGDGSLVAESRPNLLRTDVRNKWSRSKADWALLVVDVARCDPRPFDNTDWANTVTDSDTDPHRPDEYGLLRKSSELIAFVLVPSAVRVLGVVAGCAAKPVSKERNRVEDNCGNPEACGGVPSDKPREAWWTSPTTLVSSECRLFV